MEDKKVPWNDPEKLRAYHAQWRAKNREKVRAYVKKSREKHPEYAERRRELARKRRHANPEKYRKAGHAWYHSKKTVSGWARTLLGVARNGRISRRFGAPTITRELIEGLWTEQNGLCFWSGVPMNHERKSPWKTSLDRIDCSRGYEVGNVRLCTWIMNRARGNLTVEEFTSALAVIRESAERAT